MLPFLPPNRSKIPSTVDLQNNKGKFPSYLRISLLLILILMLVVWFSEMAIAKYATDKINSSNPATENTLPVTLANSISDGNPSTEKELWFGGQNGSKMIDSLDGELSTLFENGKSKSGTRIRFQLF